MYEMENWLILSQIAAQPMTKQSDDDAPAERVDLDLMLDVGSSRHILRRIGRKGYSVLPVHTIAGHGEIVCHTAGLVEPIVVAMYAFLSREGAVSSAWIQKALDRNSLPLLYRITLVLNALESSAESSLSEWTTNTLQTIVLPALLEFPPVRCD